MLKKLEKEGYVIYKARQGIELAEKGRRIAKRIIRAHRLTEVMMKETLKTDIREETVCGMEHHMDEEFMDALCTFVETPKVLSSWKRNPRKVSAAALSPIVSG